MKTSSFFTALILTLGVSINGWTSEIVVVLSANMAPYRQALAGLEKAMNKNIPSAILPEKPAELNANTKVIVTFGAKASLQHYPDGATLIAALVPNAKLKISHRGPVIRVNLLPQASRLIKDIKSIYPQGKSLAVFDVNGAFSSYLQQVQSSGISLGLKVQVVKIRSLKDLPRALQSLKENTDSLWIPPHPVLMNPKAFSLVKAFVQQKKIGLFVPVGSLAKAGALAGIAPSFEQTGHAAGLSALKHLRGEKNSKRVYPNKAQITLNLKTASSLGITVGSNAKKAAIKLIQ